VFVDRVRFSLDVASRVVDGAVEHRASIHRVARGGARGAAVSLATRKTSSRSVIAASRGFCEVENRRDRRRHDKEANVWDGTTVHVDHARERVGDRGGWREADHQLRRLAARRAALDAEEARWLVVAQREKVHEAYGFASFAEYCERVLGYRPRTARERLRVAAALETLPRTRAALATGVLSYSAVREITRRVDARTEAAWLEALAGKTVREIEELLAGHAPGDLPGDPPDPVLEPRVLRLEVDPEMYALFLETRRVLERDAGEALDDSAIVAALCERVLRGGAAEGASRVGDTWPAADRDPGASAGRDPGEPVEPDPVVGRAPYQIALSVCPRCDRATQDGGGRVIDVPAEVVERARCDADHLGVVDGDPPARLTADIPPAVRRLVHRRDHGRCTVPGCRHSAFLEIHHLVPRAQGGDHAPGRLTILCSGHHRAVHAGRLRITGEAPDRLVFRHADGTPYGADFFAEAQQALRQLGFTAAQAAGAVARARPHVAPEVGLAEVIRACLRECPRPPPP
jgi:hypothetical protein